LNGVRATPAVEPGFHFFSRETFLNLLDQIQSSLLILNHNEFPFAHVVVRWCVETRVEYLLDGFRINNPGLKIPDGFSFKDCFIYIHFSFDYLPIFYFVAQPPNARALAAAQLLAKFYPKSKILEIDDNLRLGCQLRAIVGPQITFDSSHQAR
jgi:hypothetical protein